MMMAGCKHVSTTKVQRGLSRSAVLFIYSLLSKGSLVAGLNKTTAKGCNKFNRQPAAGQLLYRRCVGEHILQYVHDAHEDMIYGSGSVV